MHELTMTVDGKALAGEAKRDVVNPAKGEPFAQVPDCTRGELDRAMEAAAAAYKPWSRDLDRRRQVLRDCAEAVKANVDEIAPLLTQEQGKPLAKAKEELIGASVWFKYTSSLEIPVEVVQDDERSRIEIRRRPLGVVGAITPWNFPVLLGVWKIAPALLAGNTVVLKPSPFTPCTSLKLGEVLRDVIPAGVVNVVSGGDELGAWMTSHPAVRKVAFTGSVETGKKVAQSCAPDLKRVTLELGGNDPAIVLQDADPEKVAEKLFWGAFENCGQVCSAIKRIYVHESLHAPLVEKLTELAKNVRIGDGMDPQTQIGPLNNAPQLERVTELVDAARQGGARITTGGGRGEGSGYFYQPTILTDVDESARIVAEEQFGPAVPVLPYRDVDEVIERANASHFGLSGSVWSSDGEAASEIAARLECGTGWVNTHMQILPHVPFGGAKWSGIGVENGPWGLLGMTEIQVINRSKS